MIGRGRETKRGKKHDTPVWSIAFRSPDTTVEFQARVPSATDGMGFEAAFEMTIAWNGAGTAAQARARALLQREVIRIAKGVSSGFTLGDRGSAEAEIGCALAEAKGTHEEVVREVAVLARLSVDKEDLDLERERERVGPRNEVERAAHRVRMERVRELQRDVLSDPQVARVWWYEQNPDLLHEIENAGAALDLMSTSGNRSGEAGEHRGGMDDPVLDAFLSGLSEWEVPSALERLTTMFEGLERRDLAERLRERWLSN